MQTKNFLLRVASTTLVNLTKETTRTWENKRLLPNGFERLFNGNRAAYDNRTTGGNCSIPMKTWAANSAFRIPYRNGPKQKQWVKANTHKR
ncbi:hypothetical protein OK016_26270 [Vibrio chagasii]|nr:hypothetical protein [Vibrio chagasii]